MNPQPIKFDWEGRTITEVQCTREDKNPDIIVQILDKEFKEKYFDKITFPFDQEHQTYLQPDIGNPLLAGTIFKAAFNKLGEPVFVSFPKQSGL